MAKKRKNTRTVYRDTKTGKFVSKSTWKRSRAHGGTRYRRFRQTISKRPKKPTKGKPRRATVRPTARPEQVYEWIVGFEYKKSRRSFDVIVTATSETQAYETAMEFLANDASGQRIIKAGFTGWKLDIARGHRSDEETGEAEYRSKHKRKMGRK